MGLVNSNKRVALQENEMWIESMRCPEVSTFRVELVISRCPNGLFGIQLTVEPMAFFLLNFGDKFVVSSAQIIAC